MAEPHIFEVELPNGEMIEVEAPADTSPDIIKKRVQAFRMERAGVSEKPVDPTEGMSGIGKFMAGAGRSVDQTGRGLKQAGTDAALYFVESNPALFGQRSMGSLVSGKDDSTAGRLRASLQSQKAEEAERRELDAPLMGTKAGWSGNLIGTIAQIVGPGGVAKLGTRVPSIARSAGATSGLNRVAAASLPTTIKGAAAQGAVIGGAQPLIEGESRLANARNSGLAGAGGAAIGQGIGALVRGGTRGVDRQVANVLTREAADVSSIQRLQQSQVPGVNRTLAEATKDEGLARLERSVRGSGVGFGARDSANNAARVSALRTIAGDDSTMAAARQARNDASLPALERAKQVTGVQTQQAISEVDALIQKYTGNPPMQEALRKAKAQIEASGGNMAYLENARQFIGKLISGQADGTNVKLPDLIAAKETLDGTMRGASADFGTYIDEFVAGSKPINRMQIGQELIGPRAGSKTLDAVTGEQVLLPASFSGMARNLDDVAQRATGFPRARAADSLGADDFATISAVQDDLERQAFRGTAGSAGNSQTSERLQMGGRLAQETARAAFGQSIPFLGAGLAYLEREGAKRLQARLTEIVLNPQQAQAILSRTPSAERLLIEKAMSRIGTASGATGSVVGGGLPIAGGRVATQADIDRDAEIVRQHREQRGY